ncbi:MAG TPA: IPT/TIG domain-containing protein [Thermoanaerobaculia bacterium]|nr:IPT/TIG domain-containing protein [Thermoanaerobaculia bacterium]
MKRLALGGMVPVHRPLFLLIVSLVLTVSLRAQTEITLTKPNSQDVLVTINGTGPFDVFRGQSADLTTNTETLSTDQAATTYTDAAAQQATAVVYYYDVVGPGESSLAVGGAGMPQQTVVITSLTPNTGAEGATVTIAGSGFSQHYPENFVTFNGRLAVVNSGTATSLNVTVPPGLSSGSVQVRVGRLISNALDFAVTPVTGFVTLMGIATYPTNNHLFVIDTQASFNTSLIEIDPFGGWTKTTRGGVANIRGLPRMSNGRLFYSNASSANSNQGTIRYYDLLFPGESTWPVAAGVATSDPVACVSMGTSPASTNYVFFADRRNNAIRRIGDISGRTTYATGFSFPNNDYGASNVAGLAGMAFDSNGTVGTKVFGDLYVSSGSSLLKVTQTAPDPDANPDVTSVTTVISSPKVTEPAGLFFDDTRTLHITDKGAGTIALYHPLADPLKRFVKRVGGLTSPRMATLGQSDTTPRETRLYVAEKSRVVALDDLRLELLPRENIRALISNCPDAANTPGCIGAAFPSAYQTTPGQVRIEARVYPPRAGVTIHFETIDPPSSAPYDTSTGPDNLGPLLTPVPENAVTDANGVATTILRFSAESAAGDNFRVLARFSPLAGQPVIARTGNVTAWKRVFIEMDKMFQKGTDLAQPAAAGATQVEVSNTAAAGFVIGETVSIFDSVNDDPEQKTIASITPGAPGTLFLTSALSRSYEVTRSGFVGRPAAGFYEADMSTAYRGFDDGYVELVYRPSRSTVLPFRPLEDLATEAQQIAFSDVWFGNGKVHKDLTNYVHVMGVGEVATTNTNGLSVSALNFVFVAGKNNAAKCAGETGSPCSAAQQVNHLRQILIHEVGHQFGLAEDPSNTVAWCGASGQSCAGPTPPQETVMAGCLPFPAICTTPTYPHRAGDINEFAADELWGGMFGAPSIRIGSDPL